MSANYHVVMEKLVQAENPAARISFTKEEAQLAGAFEEVAVSANDLDDEDTNDEY